DCSTTLYGSVSIGAGVNQSASSNFVPGAKNTENWPPSGPIQKRSSPPNTLMCCAKCPAAMSSRLTHPNETSLPPPVVLVSTRPCQAGTSSTRAPVGDVSTIESTCARTNDRSSVKVPSLGGGAPCVEQAAAVNAAARVRVLIADARRTHRRPGAESTARC